jgi:RNA polymerase sigma-70 factor (ECF subfamily)
MSVEREDLEHLPSNAVVRALGALPVNERTAVYLCDVEDFGYDEIADITQAPVKTVVSRLHEGRRLLRRLLERSAERH